MKVNFMDLLCLQRVMVINQTVVSYAGKHCIYVRNINDFQNVRLKTAKNIGSLKLADTCWRSSV